MPGSSYGRRTPSEVKGEVVETKATNEDWFSSSKALPAGGADLSLEGGTLWHWVTFEGKRKKGPPRPLSLGSSSVSVTKKSGMTRSVFRTIGWHTQHSGVSNAPDLVVGLVFFSGEWTTGRTLKVWSSLK